MNWNEIDTPILAKIHDQPGASFGEIYGNVPSAALEQAATTDPDRQWRVVDRRLQALRKQGKIAYVKGKGWQEVQSA